MAASARLSAQPARMKVWVRIFAAARLLETRQALDKAPAGRRALPHKFLAPAVAALEAQAAVRPAAGGDAVAVAAVDVQDSVADRQGAAGLAAVVVLPE